MDLHKDRRRAESFGRQAELYDRARPSYSSDLIDDLLVDSPDRVLDIGCGTGIAGRIFASRGCTVRGVEPDEAMAEIARRHGLDVDVSTFESWIAPPDPFDLLICGQAWHWIDPFEGAVRAATVLRVGGRFAAFWNFYRHEPDTLAGLMEIYAEHAPELESSSLVLGHDGSRLLPVQMEGLRASNRFADIRTRSYQWSRRCTGDEWVDEVSTHSDHRTLPTETLRTLLEGVRGVIDRMGGGMVVGHETFLLTGRKL